MAARIFTCHHLVPEHVFRPNDLFAMLISGVRSDRKKGYLGDLDGENIAQENVYSEMRHQYYVWRNLLRHYDYVGFEHYRRVFFIDPASPGRARGAPRLWQWRLHFQSAQDAAYVETDTAAVEAYLRYRSGFDAADCQAVEAWISSYDIVVPRPYIHGGLQEQWNSCLPPEAWDQMFFAVHETLQAQGSCDIDFGVKTGFFNNMYIMRSELFDQYMTFFMRCAEKILQRIFPFQRMMGHCGERIFSLWLFQLQVDNPSIRICHQPFLYDSSAVQPNLSGNYGAKPPARARKR